LSAAQPRYRIIRKHPAAAEIGEEGLRDYHPARRIDPDPIAVQGHVDAALGSVVGMGSPGDVREKTSGESQPRRFCLIVEGRSDPAIEQGTMLGKPTECSPASRAPLYQRIAQALLAAQPVVEETFAMPKLETTNGWASVPRRATQQSSGSRELRAGEPPKAPVLS
jgi:hypothetical protein